jgi:tetratricopeptide (TPR) repeat protein
MNARIFQRGDWMCGLIAALIAFAGYAWTTAPSVTMLDAGEFLVAAQHFGVPHPTGYPLWTMLAWLFHFLPLGNVAWQTALFSGVCGALAVGLAAMLIRNSSLWMLEAPDAASRTAASVCAVSLSLVFAFSFSMWSQAVIVEVYTLHALLVGLYLTSMYLWLRRPDRLSGIYWMFFLLSLAFSNHQLVLPLAILPFLLVLLVRRDLFFSLFLAVAVCALLSYLAFAYYSEDTMVIKAAIRLLYLTFTIAIVALIAARGRVQWRLILFLPFVLFIGLLPYLYMPLASATNPPMNWSYTRIPEGFFYAFNRSQYPGTLSDLSLSALSKILGVPPGSGGGTSDAAALLSGLRTWPGFFWLQIVKSFSPLAIVFFVAALVGALRQPRPPLPARVWIYLVVTAFILAMTCQPVLEHAQIDNNGWWLQMPYHTYTNFLFAIVCGIGSFFIWRWLAARAPKLRHIVWALPLLALWPISFNADGASQRNHWLGWKYGHDMLAKLPKGSVIFGGTDAGRFIPTYLILGESTLPPNRRIDPAFDRRDLYIITQNGLNDRYYLAYIRDQYAATRPKAATAFEHWLGRDTAYPETPLALPSLPEMQDIRLKAADETRKEGDGDDGIEIYRAAISGVAKWIFDRNKDKHTFYVQESFVMRWTYDYAIPEGLLYRINSEPLEKLPEDAVRKDLEFWNRYVAELKADPTYAIDYDARRNFSQLRQTGGNIYAHRKLSAAAELAYRQSIDLWNNNLDAIIGLSRILWARDAFDESIQLLDRAVAADPNNRLLRDARDQAVTRAEAQTELTGLLARWRRQPSDLTPLRRIVTLYARIGEDESLDKILQEALGRVGTDPKFYVLVAEISTAQNKWQQLADAAARWVALEPQSAEAHYQLGRGLSLIGKKKESLPELSRSIDLGGVAIRERLFRDPAFQSLRDDPELKKLLVAPQLPAGVEKSAP